MRKLLLAFIVAVVLTMAGLAIFLATFDADRYRPLVESSLESALGKPVRLERLALGWRGGIALELTRLAIYPDAQAQGEPALEVERISAVVRLLPLLRKQVQVASVVMTRPHIHVSRDAQGTINLMGLGAVAGPALLDQSKGEQDSQKGGAGPTAASGKTTALGSTPVVFNVASMRIEDGAVHWTDAMTDPPIDLWVKALDVTIRNLSLTKPVDFQARLAAFSDEQNVTLKGRFLAPANDRAGVVEAFRLDTTLSRWSGEALASAIPRLRELGLHKDLAGDLDVAFDRLVLDPKGLAQLQAQVRLVGGRLALAQLGSPLENLTVEALAQSGRIDVKRLSAKLAGGTMTAFGSVDHLESQPQDAFQATMEHLALDALLPTPGPGEPRLRGRLSMSLQGTAQGLGWSQLTQTLSGKGSLTLTEASVEHLNVLREVFRRLSILPGLVEILEARLPESSKAKLATQNTVLEPLALAITIEHGVLVFSNLRVVTDTFELEGEGRIGLDGHLSSRPTLRIEPELSAAIIKSVNEFQHLTDQRGRIEFPVTLDGTLPRVVPFPDVQYVASRLLVTKTQELLGNLLQKALEKRGGE